MEALMDVFTRAQALKKQNPDAPNPFDIPLAKVVGALGLTGLKTVAFNFQDSSDGLMLQLFIGVPEAGEYREIFNSDSEFYAGSNMGNGGQPLIADPLPWMNRSHSLSLTLPPLAGIVLQLK